MTDAKSAMLELALRAVQQHIERDEYTAAGDVVMQALARDEQMTAPDLRATFRDTMDSLDVAELAVQQEQRISDLEAKVEGYRLSSIEQWRRKKEWQGRCSKLYAQSATTADLVRRLLADHQRVEPHHADQCALCREATAAIEGRLILPVAEWVNEEQGFQYLASGRLPDGTKLYAQAAIEGQAAQGERQPDDAKDAARYRWLRDKSGATDAVENFWADPRCIVEIDDDEIDAAMK